MNADAKKFMEELEAALKASPNLRRSWNGMSFVMNDPSVVKDEIFDAFVKVYENWDDGAS